MISKKRLVDQGIIVEGVRKAAESVKKGFGRRCREMGETISKKLHNIDLQSKKTQSSRRQRKKGRKPWLKAWGAESVDPLSLLLHLVEFLGHSAIWREDMATYFCRKRVTGRRITFPKSLKLLPAQNFLDTTL